MNKYTQKGTIWETLVCEWLRRWFPRVERRAKTGAKDKGDIAGLLGVVIECKNVSQRGLVVTFNEGSRELTKEMLNAGASAAFLCVKRSGTVSPGEAYWLVEPSTVPYLIHLVEDDRQRVVELTGDQRSERPQGHFSVAPTEIADDSDSAVDMLAVSSDDELPFGDPPWSHD